MKKFLITTTIEEKIEAIDEEDALEKFCIAIENEPQQTTSTYLYDHLKVQELCPNCNLPLENKMIDLDGTNLEEHQVCEKCGYNYPFYAPLMTE